MRRRHGSASVALILLALGVLGVVVVAFSWWRLPNVGSAEGELTSSTATVVESRPCGTSAEGDLVEVRVDGQVRRLRLDGCGHSEGQQLPVRVPAEGDRALPGGGAEDGGMRSRASWVLGTLAAVAGGGYALLVLRPRALTG
ncbi:hypothetical protein ACL03H_23255 [Saccharopolyspora sp. MS10]|uniref:hypothetical protein n=1 Tax=Saccharopolyspora sp. MS10 TaxID=3385973 RepID=UPI0039A11A92